MKRLAFRVVAVASRLVPRAERGAWRREWEAELEAHWRDRRASGTPGASSGLDLLWRSLGSVVDAVRYRDGRWTMRGLTYDLVGAWKELRRHPTHAALVILTMAVGVGGSTVLFGVANDVLLRPFPYPDPDRVVAIQSFDRDRVGFAGNVTYPNLADLAERTGSFEEIGLIRWWVPALDDEEGAVVVQGGTVTANFFEVLGQSAAEGRLFRPDEEGEGRPNQVVISWGFWVDRFGADPSVVGRDLRLDGVPYTLIGVLPATFEDPWLLGGPGAEPRIWRTVASPPGEWPRSGRSWRGLGRLREDVTVEAAQADVDAAFATLAEAYPEDNAGRVMMVRPLGDVVAGPARSVLLTLLASVGLLLVIGCANLANLQLSRALERRDDLAVHRALGAPGWRIVSRGFAETVILAAAGGLVGVLFAFWAGGAVGRLGPLLPRPVDGAVDPVDLAFATCVTMGCALLFGLVPALRSAGVGPTVPGAEGNRSVTSGRSTTRLRRGLVVGQVALTMVLLVASGLLARSWQRLGGVELGFQPQGVVSIELHGSAFYGLEAEAAAAKWRAVLDAAAGVPGVVAVGAIDILPLGGGYSCDGVGRADRPAPAPGEGRCAEVRAILPGALETLDLSLVRGRPLNAGDDAEAAPVLLVDEAMAAEFWPGEDPLGKELYAHGQVSEVVGIVENMRHFGPGQAPRPTVYVPAAQEGWNGLARGFDLLVRARSGADVAGPVQAAVHSVDPAIAIGPVNRLDGLLREALAGPRFRTGLMLTFGATALLLALLGIGGVLMHSVSRRSRELGVRLALGAQPAEVRSLVLREGAVLVLLGVALGLPGAVVASGVLESMLFEVGGRDPLVFGGAALVLAGASLLACFVPARRASRVDPTRALAGE